MEPPPYRRPPRPPDLEASITYLAAEGGGRQNPVASGYRPTHNFGLPGELNDAQHEYPDVGWVQPGETANAMLWLFAPERQVGQLYPGFSFSVQEGGRIVGSGIVVAVLNETLHRTDGE